MAVCNFHLSSINLVLTNSFPFFLTLLLVDHRFNGVFSPFLASTGRDECVREEGCSLGFLKYFCCSAYSQSILIPYICLHREIFHPFRFPCNTLMRFHKFLLAFFRLTFCRSISAENNPEEKLLRISFSAEWKLRMLHLNNVEIGQICYTMRLPIRQLSSSPAVMEISGWLGKEKKGRDKAQCGKGVEVSGGRKGSFHPFLHFHIFLSTYSTLSDGFVKMIVKTKGLLTFGVKLCRSQISIITPSLDISLKSSSV